MMSETGEVLTVDVPEERRQEIPEDYQNILDKIDLLRAKKKFWNTTLSAPEFQDVLKRLAREIDETKLDWESIQAKEFPQSQAEVKAKRWIVRRLKEQKGDDEIRVQLQLKAEMEKTSPLILIAAGYPVGQQASKEDS